MPTGRGAGCVSEPKSFRMQAGVTPPRDKHPHDVGAAARRAGGLSGSRCFQRGPGIVLKHLLYSACATLLGVEKFRGGKHVIFREESLHAFRGGVNHLANAARLEGRGKLRIVEFPVDQV